MSFEANGDNYHGTQPGGSRPVIEAGRPPLDYVSAAGSPKKLLIGKPSAKFEQFFFRVIPHPAATAADFIRERPEGTPATHSVLTSWCKAARIANIYANKRQIAFRADMSPVDRDGNEVLLQGVGKDGDRRNLFPWDLFVTRAERIIQNGVGAYACGYDLGLPIDWMILAETTQFSKTAGQRVPVADPRKVRVGDALKFSGDALLMQGVWFCEESKWAEAIRIWPFLKEARHRESGGRHYVYNLMFTPTGSAVNSLLNKLLTKKDPLEELSLSNSELGDIFTYESGQSIRIQRQAKDISKPLEDLNSTHVVVAGMAMPLDRTGYSPLFSDWQTLVAEKLNCPDHMEFIVKVFEDLLEERVGKGSKFLEEQRSTLLALFRAAWIGSAYDACMPERVRNAPDLVPAELKPGYTVSWTDPATGEVKDLLYGKWLATLPDPPVLRDGWIKVLAARRRAAAGAVQDRAADAAAGPVPPPPPMFAPPAEPSPFAPAEEMHSVRTAPPLPDAADMEIGDDEGASPWDDIPATAAPTPPAMAVTQPPPPAVHAPVPPPRPPVAPAIVPAAGANGVPPPPPRPPSAPAFVPPPMASVAPRPPAPPAVARGAGIPPPPPIQ